MQTTKISFFLFIISLSLTLTCSFASDPDFKRSEVEFPDKKTQLLNTSIERSKLEAQSSMLKLKQIKYLIINGELDAAKSLLTRQTLPQSFSQVILYRYLATIYFIEGEYAKSLQILNKKEFKSFERISKICAMKVLNELILGQISDANTSWKLCQETSSFRSITGLLWLKTIVDLKNKRGISPLEKIAIDNEKEDFLRLFLKLALYLQQQERIIPRFQYFGPDVLEDSESRELIGLNYFRNGELVKAYKYLEDLETPNAEVFKGNIYLFQDKYELAYAQYKLALQKKNNSQNALERAIPVSWKLNQWTDGLEFLTKLEVNTSQTVERLTLISLFYIMNNQNQKAQETLNKILKMTNKGQSLEANQLLSINSLILNKNDPLKLFTTSACQSLDGINCWMQFQNEYWDFPGKVFAKKTSIHSELKDLVTLYSSQRIKDPIDEIQYINQKTIEQMDNEQISLIED